MRKFLVSGIALLLFLPHLALAANYEAGKQYMVLDEPVPTSDPNKVEVVEVFWYGCIHCFHFEPLISKWKLAHKDDIEFVPVPATWNERVKLHARAFYTALVLGKLEAMHESLFNAFHVENKKFVSESEIQEFFAKFGVDKDTFDKAFNSFGVKSMVTQADAKIRGYKIEGTPEIIVDGKYRITGRMAGSQAEMLKVADFLIANERKTKPGS